MEKKMETTIYRIWGLGFARNERMDPYSGLCITHYKSCLFLFHSFIPSYPEARLMEAIYR